MCERFFFLSALDESPVLFAGERSSESLRRVGEERSVERFAAVGDSGIRFISAVALHGVSHGLDGSRGGAPGHIRDPVCTPGW
jgi:hypothetical protein